MTEHRPPFTLTRRHVVSASIAAVLATAAYAVGVLLPYLVNGLNRLPLAEVASGRHDPKDLWPHSGWAHLLGALSTAVSPLVLVCVALGSTGAGVWALLPWRGVRHGSRAVAIGFAVLAVCSVAALAWLLGPTGTALSTWQAD